MSTLSSWVATILCHFLNTYCGANDCGWVFGEGTGYQCFPDEPGTVRKPDASFIRKDRLPPYAWNEGYCSLRPDLAVEVISPNDLAWDIDRKIAAYLAAGVPLVWVVHPEARAVRVHRKGGEVSWLRDVDELSGEDVLPGFRCQVAALFPAGNDPSRNVGGASNVPGRGGLWQPGRRTRKASLRRETCSPFCCPTVASAQYA